MNNQHLGLGDFKDSNIEKSYQPQTNFLSSIPSKSERLEKAAHKNHKYLRIENGKYIYDESKMTSKDHEDAADVHRKNMEEANKKNNGSKFHYEMSHRDKHKALAKEKAEKEKEDKEFKEEKKKYDFRTMTMAGVDESESRTYLKTRSDVQLKTILENLEKDPDHPSHYSKSKYSLNYKTWAEEEIKRRKDKVKHKIGDHVVDKDGKTGKVTEADDKEVAVEHDNGDVTGYKHDQLKKKDSKEDKSEKNNLKKSEDFEILGLSKEELIEKSSHKIHKYLRIENGKYIYNTDKMTSRDHKESAEHHKIMKDNVEEEIHLRAKGGETTSGDLSPKLEKEVKYHQTLYDKHKTLSNEKSVEEKKLIFSKLKKIPNFNKLTANTAITILDLVSEGSMNSDEIVVKENENGSISLVVNQDGKLRDWNGRSFYDSWFSRQQNPQK